MGILISKKSLFLSIRSSNDNKNDYNDKSK